VVVVAAGVLIDQGGRVLIARRHASAHQGGLWEFPGGKVALNETLEDALVRELSEELGITVQASQFLTEIDHDYGDKQVRLVVFHVTQWSGEPRGCEGQPLAWVDRADLPRYDFPEANQPILEALDTLQFK
jgi:8-oxo-dGTP diphosphatase